MSDIERAVLTILAETHGWDENYHSFQPIMDRTGLDRRAVRRACRSLTRKGLAQYSRALCNPDGNFAGAGYASTTDGLAALGNAA